MRKTLLTSAAMLGIALALPAFAQTATDPNPANPSAIKDGTPAAGTGSGAAPASDPAAASQTGATLGAKAPQNDPGPMGNTANPAPASSGSAMSAPAAGTDTAPSSMGNSTSGADTSGSDQAAPTPKPKHMHRRAMSSNDGSGHWAHEPGTGESGPASKNASNIDGADTHSEIAPHLPAPGLAANAGPDRYLEVADRALKAHKTGEAQQALEMAETRLLDRSTEAGNASQPDQNPRIAAVTAARKALASKDWAGARRNIETAMNTADSAGTGSESGGGSGGMASGSPMQGGTPATGMSSGGNMAPMAGSSGNPAPMGAGTTGSGNAGSVANGNAGTTPAPMDPTGQGPATTGAAGTPTTGAATTAPNQMAPASGAK
jgi:hypothetical protein